MQKTRTLIFLAIFPCQTLSECQLYYNQGFIPDSDIFKSGVILKDNKFKLNQISDDRISQRSSSYFVWKENKMLFFTDYITYSSGAYTRDMILNANYICSIDEFNYILSKNKNNFISVALIKNPRSEGFMDRNNDLLVSRATYIDFTFYFIIESIKNNVKFEILDSWNYSSIAKKKIK